MPSITPHLWFDNAAEEAAELYCSTFPDSRILAVHRFENSGPRSDQTIRTVEFEVLGQRVIGLDGGPHFQFDEAFSFFVSCDTQEEVDEYWEKLTANDGRESECGWLKDRFGLSWQIVPKLLHELLADKNRERAGRVMEAMLRMRKIDCAALHEAYDQPIPAA